MTRLWKFAATSILFILPFICHAQQECAEKQNQANIAARATQGWIVLPSAKQRAADTKADYDACVSAAKEKQAAYAAQLQREQSNRRQDMRDHAPAITVGFSGKPLPRDPSLDPAGLYTPDAFSQAALGHGWIEFSDSPEARLWMAYNLVGENQPRVAWVALKRAEKGINGGFTGLTAIGGQALCGADGSAPNFAHIVYAFKYASNGAPIASDGPVGTFALTPGTPFAVAIQLACRHLPVNMDVVSSKSTQGARQQSVDALFLQMDQADRTKETH